MDDSCVWGVDGDCDYVTEAIKAERERASRIIDELLCLACNADSSCRDADGRYVDCGHGLCRETRETIESAEEYLKGVE